jgi:ABC-type nitrate/sulfonate/bicarbonate transport system substrate-binding protein
VHIPGTSADFAMRLALMKVGIPYKDIKAITVGGAPARLAAVTQGQTDFTVVTDGERIQGEKMGMRVIIDMAKLNVPFQFNCSVTTRKKIRENPDEVRRVVLSMAESIHYFKTHKDVSIKVMQKYTRGLSRDILEGAYAANSELLVEDTYPTLEGLKTTLDVQALTDPRAAKFKAEDMVELRFVDEMRKSGFIDKLYGRK